MQHRCFLCIFFLFFVLQTNRAENKEDVQEGALFYIANHSEVVYGVEQFFSESKQKSTLVSSSPRKQKVKQKKTHRNKVLRSIYFSPFSPHHTIFARNTCSCLVVPANPVSKKLFFISLFKRGFESSEKPKSPRPTKQNYILLSASYTSNFGVHSPPSKNS